MILRNFAGQDGRLYFWRRDFERGDIRATTPENLFVEGDLYTVVGPGGAKNVALEEFFSSLEGTGAAFLRQLLDIVRSGKVPAPDAKAWEFWLHFWYYQSKRAPAYIRSVAEKVGHNETLERAAADFIREHGSSRREEAALLADPAELARIGKNAMVMAQSLPPGDEVLEMMRSRGMTIYLVSDPKKSLVVGEVPAALARIGNSSSSLLGGLTVFMPVARDVAIGLNDRPRHVEVIRVDGDQVRRMNVATAEQSNVFAGDVRALLASLSMATRYLGVKLMSDREALDAEVDAGRSSSATD